MIALSCRNLSLHILREDELTELRSWQRMNGKKGSVRIDIRTPETAKMSGGGGGSNSDSMSPSKWIWDVWEFAKEDTDRVTFSLKAGLACLLVSLLILIRAPYQVFGTNTIWAIMTVAIMFEYTVGMSHPNVHAWLRETSSYEARLPLCFLLPGATFNRGFNRALGSLLAGIFAVVFMQIAMSSGHIAEPYIIGLSIFLVGAITSFMKLWPSLVPYEYGFRVILLTYCLIIASGYRAGDPVKTAVDRLYSIAIGGLIAVLVNLLVLPIWAGEQLHKELVSHFDSVADSLEECVKKYLSDDGSEQPEFSKTVMDDFQDEPAYRKCRATLSSSAKLDSLANSARWEPPHGRFRHFFYPWAEYVNVGAVLRYCAYEVMALHGCLHSEIQAPLDLRCAFQYEILDATTQAAELLRSMGRDISNMKHGLRTSLLKRVHSSTERLQRSIDLHSYLLTSSHHLSTALSSNLVPSRDHSTDPDSKGVEPNAAAATAAARVDSCHDTPKKQQRRMRSWPSIEVADLQEDDIRRMSTLESTTALSLATFTSLLIEFVARLDHLVEAVDKLARLAGFS
ncbi:Fusaric acid resistance protein family [Musa troglodytarum]|uniref:Fusaric acid resistance protein family n=1 Tax=Musa troglodytarum TaxID=320322 RepID=A0A9E7IE59_9LILI|nr:Fusaric acid resistance protein family [Musa troglodytarum]